MFVVYCLFHYITLPVFVITFSGMIVVVVLISLTLLGINIAKIVMGK